MDELIRRRVALLGVRDEVRDCTRCELSQKCRSPVPIFGPTSPRYVVIGQSPGQIEDYKGIPFIGPAGRLLKNMLREAKLNPEEASYMNVVSCMPKGTDEDKHAVGANHIEACRHNLEIQLMATCCELVLLCGAVALHSFLPQAQLKWAQGGMYNVHGFHAMSIFHPSYVLQSKSKDLKADVVGHLHMFARVLDGSMPLDWLRNNHCIYCGGSIYLETPACSKHQKQWRADSQWKKPEQGKMI